MKTKSSWRLFFVEIDWKVEEDQDSEVEDADEVEEESESGSSLHTICI